MFGLPIWQLAAAGLVAAFLAGSHYKAFTAGESHVQRAWDADKTEQRARQATADESARLKARAAAMDYEAAKTAQRVRVVTVTRSIEHEISADPDCSARVLPVGLRSALAAAAAADPAQPDGAVSVPAGRAADLGGSGPGLRIGARRAGGLPGQAPGTGQRD